MMCANIQLIFIVIVNWIKENFTSHMEITDFERKQKYLKMI